MTTQRTGFYLSSRLQADLKSSHVCQRQQSGMSLSYLESWFVIDQMNEIFGFANWWRETELMLQFCEERENKFYVTYTGKCKITVDIDCSKVTRVGHGVGHGNGIRDKVLAIESAMKEAESDAMKRAAMTFGNQFGLALYDKNQTCVVNDDHQNSFIEYVQNCNIEDERLKTLLRQFEAERLEDVPQRFYKNFTNEVQALQQNIKEGKDGNEPF